MKALLVALAASLAAAAAAPPPSAPAADAAPPFRCGPAPKGWTKTAEDGRAVYLGPKDSHEVAAQIEVRWVAPGDPGRPDADAFVARLTAPAIVEPSGWKTHAPEKTTLAGRAARRVLLETSLFVPPHSRFSKEVPMREEYVVLQGKTGYYVLVYQAPASIAAKNARAFKAVRAGFAPSY